MSTARLIVALIAGTVFGWAAAQKAVATDCERLGAFYDGVKVRHCVSQRPSQNTAAQPKT